MSPPPDEAPLARVSLSVEVAIRHCREADLPRLEWFGAFADHRQVFREAWDLRRRGEAIMLVADAAGFPIGQAWLDLRPRPGAVGPMVWAVRVMEPFQGCGVGAELMRALEELARASGHAQLELGVERANTGARAFYEKLGWRTTRERQEPFSYTTPDGEAVTHILEEWVMVKPLR